ncbi:MAG: aminotransferase class I/II-fold pyridoxal phosphate-dependent enzyme [Anaerolineaceae bacterium]|jgi:LL-diaminopimelate aminotransferase
MKIIPAKTVQSIQPYFFDGLNKTIRQLRAEGMNIIRLDMGSPDLPPADFIIDKLVEAVRDPKKHGYSPLGGSPEFLKAACDYYLRRFNVELDPKTEALALIGSKEGIFNINHTMLDPGDLVLMPDPYYPVYIAGAQLADAEVYYMPLLKENEFLPVFEDIPEAIAKKAKMMWLNYPNNPTGAVAGLDFFSRAVDFAIKNEIVIVHDAPYTELTFDSYIAPSLLQVPRAKEVCIEFNSLSKTYNMAGWRVGMALGNAEVIKYLATYKSQIDTSLFTPIMDAAIEAMTADQEWIQERNEIYAERRDVVYEGLKAAGFEVDLPKAALYLWAKVPEGFEDTIVFCDRLLREAGVSFTPGVVYGPSGKDYVRLSIITPTDQIRTAMERLVKWVKTQ